MELTLDLREGLISLVRMFLVGALLIDTNKQTMCDIRQQGIRSLTWKRKKLDGQQTAPSLNSNISFILCLF